MKPAILALGVMTGNSLDGVDTVISRFSGDGRIEDASHFSMSFPAELADRIRSFREHLRLSNGNIGAAEEGMALATNNPNALNEVHDAYVSLVTAACRASIEHAREARKIQASEDIDIIGIHGQTCAHQPPSIAQKSGDNPYTVQMGNGQVIADTLNIPTAYDFRSDDIMNGGEGAPLAPMHHLHLATVARKAGAFPIAFINGGNTGNVSIITHQLGKKDAQVFGWDTGPFNHLPDLLARREANLSHDANGEIGSRGVINKSLLKLLFDKSAQTSDGRNFFIVPPPRSSDPQWYRAIPELLGEAPVDGAILSLPDRMRTVEYLSAYTTLLGLSFIPHDCEVPHFYGLCGGGWKNPIVREHFRSLLQRDTSPIVLDEHQSLFASFFARLRGKSITVESTKAFGFDPDSMEARIFADAAARLVWGEPFTQPSITHVARPTVCGHIALPSGSEASTFKIGAFMSEAGTLLSATSKSLFKDVRFGRAIKGWEQIAR